MTGADIKAALSEILSKSDEDMERETAEKWAAMSVACVLAYTKDNDKRYLARASDYKHEALEHAALIKDYGKTVGSLQNEIEKHIKALLKE